MEEKEQSDALQKAQQFAMSELMSRLFIIINRSCPAKTVLGAGAGFAMGG
jgi:hypothetical protein